MHFTEPYRTIIVEPAVFPEPATEPEPQAPEPAVEPQPAAPGPVPAGAGR